MKQRIKTILVAISHGLLEREEAIALSLLSALADESIFLLGLPGVGKSMVARRLKTAFAEARSFEYLMSRFSTPDEIFGPVCIAKLKDADTYERITKGYLPEAEIVFLDEIWKAGPAIQNALLTVLNEKTYLNGNRLMALPVKAIISASNELPAEGEGLEALWDRFIIRYVVEPISQRTNFVRLICQPQCQDFPTPQPLTQEECRLITGMKEAVTIPKSIVDAICNIRERLNEMMATGDGEAPNTKYYISDRRWKKAVGVMKTSACLNGRAEVDASDTLLLCHMLWNDDAMAQETQQIVCEQIAATLLKDMLDRKKSAKRHAVSKKSDQMYSPDGKHYVALCDGYNLKISIEEYELLLQSGEYRFGSETADERIVLRDIGSLALQAKERGKIIINGYSYPLATSVDQQITSDALAGMADGMDSATALILKQISDNIFANESRFAPMIKSVIASYARRMNQ